MYIFQKAYKKVKEKDGTLTAVLLLPSPPNEYRRFKEVVKEVIMQLNEERESNPWRLKILSRDTSERSPESNYSDIYNADVIIAECSEKKPNIFYMLGLAHATGVPVCSCYRIAEKGDEIDIPFNVHGRQSLTYIVSDIQSQYLLNQHLKEWIIKNEKN